MAYQNGKIPASALTPIAGGALVTKPTANAANRAIAGAKKRGVTLTTYGKYAGFRSLSVQAAMRRAFIARDLDTMREYNMSLTSRATPAPAGYSPHGLALAIDFANWQNAASDLRANGFHQPFPESDPNHWVHDGKTSIGAIQTVKRVVTPRKFYIVKSGDTFGAIARAHGKSIARLHALNPQVHNINVIDVGDKIYYS